MVKIVRGDRVARLGRLALGCTAVIFDPSGSRVLLTQRADNHKWCLPGGHMEPGESAEEACLRETFEETGLKIKVTRLIGVYSDPHQLVEYADGNRYHSVVLSFAATIESGEPGTSDEVLKSGFFLWKEIETMDVMQSTYERLVDALEARPQTFVR